jgi:hypothetical protein
MIGTTTLYSPEPVILNSLSKSILQTLLYFDIFSHPLTSNEILHCCHENKISQDRVEEELRMLTALNLLSNSNGYYFIGSNNGCVMRRMVGESASKKAMETAVWFSRLMSKFPFVQGIYISGTLSKGYMDKESDIDYFVITKPGRLWLSRSLLVLFKKIFLLNSKKYFCVNYFIDSDSLAIPDRNIFTATELVFILPTYNYELYVRLMKSNDWTKKYYPHFPIRENACIVPTGTSRVKEFLEYLFNGKLGERLDVFFFGFTIRHWKKKFPHFDAQTFDHRLRSKKNVSKHHPRGFQEKVLEALEEKIRSYEMLHEVELR